MDEKFFDVVNAIQDLYVSYRGRYLISVDGHNFVPKKGNENIRLDSRAICGHLNHRFAVSVFAGKVCSKFLCFDVDNGSRDAVHRIIKAIVIAGFQEDKIYVSLSGRKGYHIEMFFDKLMRSSVLKAFYNYVCAEAGVSTYEVEFRPTEKQSIKLPLCQHPNTGNICWYVDRDTLEPIEDISYVLSIQKYVCEDAYRIIRFNVGDDSFFGNVCVTVPAEKKKEKEPTRLFEFSSSGKYGYPDLMSAGNTHNTILAIAVHERYKGVKEEDIVDRLNDWLSEQNEQFLTDSMQTIRKDIIDAARWVYSEDFLVYAKPKLIFTADEVKLLIERRPKVQRKLLFLIFCYQKKYGVLRMGADTIAEKIGYSRVGVMKAADALEKEGTIQVSHQRAAVVGETYRHLPNIYKVVGRAKNPDSIWTLGDEISIETGDLLGMWKSLVKQSLRDDDRPKYFTAKEIEELEREDSVVVQPG